jgi:hypothetical protein
MHSSKLVLLWIWLSLGVGVRGQFYAPETEFHDLTQRMFPVECARVIVAWQNAIGHPLPSGVVTYEVKSSSTTHSWKISLTGHSGEKSSPITVNYPNSLLKSGPEFYREVSRQIAAQLKVPARAGSGSVAASYWSGSSLARLSREASLTNAFALAATLSATNQDVVSAKLAGLLVHATLPGTAGQVTLDGVLLARAATWLALSESLTGEKVDALWMPILFQSGRAPDAETVWKLRPPGWADHAFVRLWDVWLSRPNSQAVYLAATDKEARPIGVAMLFFDAIRDDTWPLLEDLLPLIVPDPAGQREMHNYGPRVATRGSVGHGHQVAAAAVQQRIAWLQLLGQRAADGEVSGLADVLSPANQGLRAALLSQSKEEPAVAGLEAIAPLIRFAEKESVGPLLPTSTASVRDLLCYGWEMGGWQLGARFRFLDQRYGSRNDSRPVKSASLRVAEGWAPFLEASSEQQPGRAGAMHRLQFVTETVTFASQFYHPYVGDGDRNDGEAVRTFISRCWLQSRYLGWFQAGLGAAKLDNLIPTNMERLLADGGVLQSDAALDYLASLNSAGLRKIPGLFELRKQLATTARQPNATTVKVLYDDIVSGKDALARAQEMERLFWRNTDSGLEERTFRAYAAGGHAQEASRFYFRIRSLLTDPIKVSNGIGQHAWMMGYCAGDKKLRQAALKDSLCGSVSDLQLQAWEAAANADVDGFRAATREITERYPESNSASSWRRIHQFAPLLPALADKKHRDRERALDYFGRDALAVVLRWIWIRHYQLPKDDAIRFLGGHEPDYIRKVLALTLQKDVQGADAALCDVNAPKTGITAQSIMAYWAFYEIHGAPTGLAEDVMPASARFTRAAVNDRLKNAK